MNRAYFVLIIFCTVLKAFTQGRSNPAEPEQLTTLKLDIDKGTISSSIPFDKFYKLQILSKNGIPGNSIFIYEVKYVNFCGEKIRTIVPRIFNKDWIDATEIIENSDEDIFKNLLEKRLRNLKCQKHTKLKEKSIIEIDSINRAEIKYSFLPSRSKPIDSSRIIKAGKEYTATLNPVRPGKLLEIVLKKKIGKTEIDLIYQHLDLIDQNDEFEKFYLEKLKSQEKQWDRTVKTTFIPPSLILRNKIYPILKTTLKTTNDLIEQRNEETNVFCLSRDEIPEISKELLKNDLEVDKFTFVFYDFLTLTNEEQKKILSGEMDLISKKKTSATRISKRLEALKRTKGILDTLTLTLQKLVLIDGRSPYKDFLETEILKKRSKVIQSNLQDLESLLKENLKYIDGNMGIASVISASSIPSDSEKRNAKTLISDFGLINSFAYNNKGEIQYIPRPYVGLNIHLGGGVDKEQKLNQIINKRFWHSWSIAIGVTIGKIDNNGYSDFYNSLSPSIGMNYRLHEQIRMGTGVLFVREKNPNPIIDDNNIEPAIYLSLSFDTNLISTAGKLVTKFLN